jgi:hypothetical protein
MTRTSIIAIVLLCCSAPLFASHRKLPSKKEAKIMLQQAADAANLWEAGTPPYHLSAVVHLELGRQTFKGRYDLWWAAPDKYREGFLMPAEGGTIVETDLALGDKFYVLRNAPTLSIPLFETRNALHGVVLRIRGTRKDKVQSIYRNKRRQETCIEAGNGDTMGFTKSCFDPTQNLMSSDVTPNPMVDNTPAAVDAGKSFAWSLDQFAGFAGTKRFPHRIVVHRYDLTLTLAIKTLEQRPTFNSDTFQPMPRSTVSPWCANPTVGNSSEQLKELRTLPSVELRSPGSYIAYYIRVQRDGRVSEVVPVSSGGKSIDHRMENWLRTYRHSVLTCSGRTIPWESIFVVPETISFY